MPERYAPPARLPRVRLSCAWHWFGGGRPVKPSPASRRHCLARRRAAAPLHHWLWGQQYEAPRWPAVLASIPVPCGDTAGWAPNGADAHPMVGIEGRRAPRIDNQRCLGGV